MNIQQLAEIVIRHVREFVQPALDGIAEEIKGALERLRGEMDQKFERLPVPRDGNDGCSAYEVAVSLGFQGSVHDWMESLTGEKGEPGQDGRSVSLDDIRPLIEDAVKSIPTPKDGKDGLDGKSVTIEEIRPLVEEAVKSIPAPKDGKDGSDGQSVTLDDVRPLIDEAVSRIPIPKDGRDGDSGPKGDRGDIGPPGERGGDGKSVTLDEVRAMLAEIYAAEQAKWALDFERRAADLIQRCIDRIPKPLDGKDGAPGRDAFDLEDIQVSLSEDNRTLTLAFMRGDQRVERTITLHHLLYQGIYKHGESYQRGDSVTWGGSIWVAVRDTSSKPETDDSWKLAAKRGRDGKDGQRGEKGERGLKGLDGNLPRQGAI